MSRIEGGKAKPTPMEAGAQPRNCGGNALTDVPKKKRNLNPGVRQQGGRIYDSENGTSCHQCRQKTIEIKARCTSCPLHFCPRCLENRYSEIVDDVNARPDWRCPRCRGLCNCSNCRKKAGLEATGILAGVAKTAGFASVSDLLQTNPKAQAIHMLSKQQQRQQQQGIPNVKKRASVTKKERKTPLRRMGPTVSHPQKRHATVVAHKLVDDSELGPRPHPMPLGNPLEVHAHAAISTHGTGDPPSKRRRGPSWLSQIDGPMPLDTNIDPGELACILEFMAAFGPAVLEIHSSSIPGLAAELVQPASSRRASLLCPVPQESVAAAVHVALLNVIRNAWELPQIASLGNWQVFMQAYYTEVQRSPAEATALRQNVGPPAVAQDLIDSGAKCIPTMPGKDSDEEDRHQVSSTDKNRSVDCSARSSNAVEVSSSSLRESYVIDQYPDSGGYHALAPSKRVSMLCSLIHDALDTYIVRDAIDAGFEGAAHCAKARKSELAKVKKAAKEAMARHRDREIALLVAGGSRQGISLEQQRSVVDEARRKAQEAEEVAAAAASMAAISDAFCPPCVRIAPLGFDRDGAAFYSLASGEILSGHAGSLIMVRSDGQAAVQTSPNAVVAALDAQGRLEGPLRGAIVAARSLESTHSAKYTLTETSDNADENLAESVNAAMQAASPAKATNTRKRPNAGARLAISKSA